MRLSVLLQSHFAVPVDMDREIARLALDSRTVAPGDLFFAVQGHATDGRAFIEEAVKRGAGAILFEPSEAQQAPSFFHDVPLIPTPGLKDQLGLIAHRFYGEPSQHLQVAGVTGTNGKTTCTHMIAQVLPACGVIGTLGIGVPGALTPSPLTTPDALTLHGLLRTFLERGLSQVAMEVTSHSIHQGRIHGIQFETRIFTNLSQDHLDYHHDMAEYADVKRRFVMDPHAKQIIVNADDAYGASWLQASAARDGVFAYTTQAPLAADSRLPTLFAEHITLTAEGTHADLHTPWGKGKLRLPLLGAFNVSNALPVIALAALRGMPLSDILMRLAQLKPIPGRLQRVSSPTKGALVVVDFAHTPDALQKTLLTLRPLVSGRLICLFGCGGSRDALKRPLMARCVEEGADQVIVTTDNPRQEEPAHIVADIMRGFKHPEQVRCIADRKEAIAQGLSLVGPQDALLIAGRGGETHQKIGDRLIPFDDVAVVSELLNIKE
jgi:UDP-N-acetylmuramoyl-L-alanyl-D-glutamate--2,6-diaminopimelate ligase